MNKKYLLQELTFEITKKCPMKCILCSSNGGEPYEKEFSLDHIKNIIDDSIKLGTEHVNISGGEPFSHPNIIDISTYISNKGLSQDIYTCGSVENNDGKLKSIDINVLKKLKENSIRSLIFSIHGDKPELHDYVTKKKGSYTALIQSIQTAIKAGLETELHFVPTKLNYRSLPNIMDIADSLGINRVSVLRFVSQGRGWENREILELSPEDIMEFKKIMKEVREKYPPSRFRIGTPFNCFHLSNSSRCTAGIDKATIKSDGHVFPCVSMKDFLTERKDNTLWQDALSKIWEDSSLFEMSRRSLEIIENESTCSNCKYFNQCRGGCLTQRLIINKLEYKDPYCSMIISDYIKKYIIAH